VEEVLSALPRPDPRRLHAIAEHVAGRRDAAELMVFMALLRRALATALRQAGRGAAAAPWLGHRDPADWAGLWDRLGRLAEETERLNLDRKQAVLTGLAWLGTR
jgi:DNA polymerase III subunit delta'